ncbi:hypothetical protein L202_04822 [Cryptococcus amylolentus CBS 6039]|uniref:Uncharacterized protein n=1 Tax=Cryptococcus amylolentus CBS 6039 TaxID=1295533 RepID=A0A1E3HMU6_9TREE|nr:hypothetical protein L202_04822 [Cryptococcus amylolentus CBS 6039]ODN77672.1 hypothetical protein L202_04822 [Cryptococcus amylolentus CBS 6039]
MHALLLTILGFFQWLSAILRFPPRTSSETTAPRTRTTAMTATPAPALSETTVIAAHTVQKTTSSRAIFSPGSSYPSLPFSSPGKGGEYEHEYASHGTQARHGGKRMLPRGCVCIDMCDGEGAAEREAPVQELALYAQETDVASAPTQSINLALPSTTPPIDNSIHTPTTMPDLATVGKSHTSSNAIEGVTPITPPSSVQISFVHSSIILDRTSDHEPIATFSINDSLDQSSPADDCDEPVIPVEGDCDISSSYHDIDFDVSAPIERATISTATLDIPSVAAKACVNSHEDVKHQIGTVAIETTAACEEVGVGERNSLCGKESNIVEEYMEIQNEETVSKDVVIEELTERVMLSEAMCENLQTEYRAEIEDLRSQVRSLQSQLYNTETDLRSAELAQLETENLAEDLSREVDIHKDMFRGQARLNADIMQHAMKTQEEVLGMLQEEMEEGWRLMRLRTWSFDDVKIFRGEFFELGRELDEVDGDAVFEEGVDLPVIPAELISPLSTPASKRKMSIDTSLTSSTSTPDLSASTSTPSEYIETPLLTPATPHKTFFALETQDEMPPEMPSTIVQQRSQSTSSLREPPIPAKLQDLHIHAHRPVRASESGTKSNRKGGIAGVD